MENSSLHVSMLKENQSCVDVKRYDAETAFAALFRFVSFSASLPELGVSYMRVMAPCSGLTCSCKIVSKPCEWAAGSGGS